MLILGYISSISFPLIGYFDKNNYTTAHYILAIIYFASTAFSGLVLGNLAQRYKDQFKTSDCWISVVYWESWIMLGLGLGFL